TTALERRCPARVELASLGIVALGIGFASNDVRYLLHDPTFARFRQSAAWITHERPPLGFLLRSEDQQDEQAADLPEATRAVEPGVGMDSSVGPIGTGGGVTAS